MRENANAWFYLLLGNFSDPRQTEKELNPKKGLFSHNTDYNKDIVRVHLMLFDGQVPLSHFPLAWPETKRVWMREGEGEVSGQLAHLAGSLNSLDLN